MCWATGMGGKGAKPDVPHAFDTSGIFVCLQNREKRVNVGNKGGETNAEYAQGGGYTRDFCPVGGGGAEKSNHAKGEYILNGGRPGGW